jgi:hypothetical protein
MPRYECTRDDIPTKWAEVHMIPGTEDEWFLIMSNGVADPAGTEITINKPAPEARGSFDEVTLAMEKRINELEKLGYKLIIKKQEDELSHP